ncbi:carbohydrate ABC transporter permease [Paenibacillus turpanensis]|uniref:carbohydrate ABC transporter permease n=1 Tax=Paenibacillus turpanensis TaxID=2689078 RepID=UPI0014097429|nr:carbohydrate ABC transporter permease [Paenibacillus turpanensis]
MKNARLLMLPLRHIVLLGLGIVMAFPFLWMLTSSLKTNDEIWSFPPVLWPAEPMWANFAEAWTAAPFGLYLFNSVFVATIIVLIQTINSAMMAFALTHMRFPLANALFLIILVSYMLPVSATYLPSYVILSNLGLIDTYAGLIVSNAVSVFSIFFVRQAFLQLPKELVEAAKIDGASNWRILWTMAFPLARSSFVILGLITFIQMYNNYFWPSLITKNPDLHLVSAGLRSFFVEGGAYGMKWPLVMAASTLTILPLLLLFAVSQRLLMKGVSHSFGVNKG